MTQRISEDGSRQPDPEAIPLVLALLLFDAWLYVDQTTSEARQQAGRRRLDYVYLEPVHIPLERILADAMEGEKVVLGENHKDIRRQNVRKVPDSNRTKSRGWSEAMNAALALYREAATEGRSLGLTEAAYRNMLRLCFEYYDSRTRDELKAAAE